MSSLLLEILAFRIAPFLLNFVQMQAAISRFYIKNYSPVCTYWSSVHIQKEQLEHG